MLWRGYSFAWFLAFDEAIFSAHKVNWGLSISVSTTKMASRINIALSECNDISKSLRHSNHTELDDHLLWTKDTWYTPHRDAQHSTTAAHLFGSTETVLVIEDDEDENTLTATREHKDDFVYRRSESS